MTFKLVEKGILGCRLKPYGVGVCKKSISFGEKIREFFKGYYGCEIYVDEEKNLLGFKHSNNTTQAYSLGEKKSGVTLCSKKVKLAIDMEKIRGEYKGKIKGDMVIIKLKNE